MAYQRPYQRRMLVLGAALALNLSAAPVHCEPPEAEVLPEERASKETAVKVVLQRDRSGNYMGEGAINGRNVRFLVDTGASTVIVPEAIAKRIGLRKGKAMSFRTGGGAVTHYATELDTLSIGRIQISEAPAAINPEMKEEFVLLGMSALGLLHFSQEGDNLVLSYDPGPAATTGTQATVPDVKFQRMLSDCMGKGNVIDRKTLACLKGN